VYKGLIRTDIQYGAAMPFIVWIPAYDVGNAEIDDQHRRLVALTNVLHDAAISGESSDHLGPALKELVDYARSHFASEEALFAKYAPDELPLQKAAHRRWVAKIRDVLCISGSNPQKASLELAGVLKSFLLKHVLSMDKRLTAYLPANTDQAA
jgi:hemerythrin